MWYVYATLNINHFLQTAVISLAIGSPDGICLGLNTVESNHSVANVTCQDSNGALLDVTQSTDIASLQSALRQELFSTTTYQAAPRWIGMCKCLRPRFIVSKCVCLFVV